MTLPDMSENRKGMIFLVNQSKRCEPSAFLFTRAVKFLLVNGYQITNHIDNCDSILVNTCCVTEDKIAASRSALDFARERGRGKRIILFGCMASLSSESMEKEGMICIGPKNISEMDLHFAYHTSISDISVNRLSPDFYQPGQGLGYRDYFIMIAQGCTNRCSYCNIKRSKGEVKSELPETILPQILKGLSLGISEFAILADDCASYGYDIGIDLVQLIGRFFDAGPEFKLKLGYIFPRFILEYFDELKSVFGTGRIRYVNIPVQSGSQRILNLMNRPYPIDCVMEAVGELRRIAPQTTFCTHIMVNFPTESRDDFLMSLSTADGFDEVLFLQYSDNRDTAAAGIFPKVPVSEVSRRLDMASDYANHCKRGRGAVIKDFNCDIPYNLLGTIRR